VKRWGIYRKKPLGAVEVSYWLILTETACTVSFSFCCCAGLAQAGWRCCQF